jgi:UDP-N-acetyl-2-amino-2-deoxyglucuronate dehydrogenase
MKQVKFAIIGCGRIAQRHAEHISKIGLLEAVCDIKIQRAIDLANKYNCNHYNNIDDLLLKEKECDIVSICTPNGLHMVHTLKALEKNKHVLCEKPMATSKKDCQLMIDAAAKMKKHLFIVKQNRFNPPVAALKKVIEEGQLGKILNVQLNCFWNRNEAYYRDSDWKGKKSLDGGTLFTQFSHFIDLIYWLIGDIKKVFAITGNLAHQDLIEFEDTGVIALEFSNGALGTINYTVNSHEKNMEGSITIFGTKGTVKVGGQYLNVLEYQSIENFEIKNIPESRPANEYGFYQGSMSNHDKVYANIIDVLNNEGQIATSGEEGFKTVEIIEKIYHSAKLNQNKEK